jgi:hypothetical protein
MQLKIKAEGSKIVEQYLARKEGLQHYLRSREEDTNMWSGRVDLNHRPQRPERCALPG